MTIDSFVEKFTEVIIEPLILLLFALALLLFLWGIVVFIAKMDSEDERKKGARHMIWGLVGMFVMLSVYGIVNLIGNTLYQGSPPEELQGRFPIEDI